MTITKARLFIDVQHRASCVALILLIALIGMTSAAQGDDPLSSLHATYDGVRVHESGGRPVILFGAPMTPGLTVDDAADRFWAEHGRVFRGNQPELTRRWAVKQKNSHQTILAYNQTIRGIPVEGAAARMIVATVGGVPRVTYVSARLAGEPTVGSEHPVMPREVAAAIVRNQPEFANLGIRGEPELVVVLGNRQRGDAWAWRVRTLNSETRSEPRTFYVDTLLAQVLSVRKDWVNGHADDPTPVEVTVRGKISPGMLPNIATNPPSYAVLPDVRVGWRPSGGSTWTDSFTDANGFFEFDSYPHTSVDVRSVLGPTVALQARHFYVVDANNGCTPSGVNWMCGFASPTAASQAASSSAPGTVALDFLSSSNATISQMNVVNHLARCRSYLAERMSESTLETLLPHTLRVIVNPCVNLFTGVLCNAFYVSDSWCPEGRPMLVFGRPSGVGGANECRDFAYSSWIAHEWGHYLLDALIGDPTGHPDPDHNSFGEGFGDTLSLLVYDDPLIGRDYKINASYARDPVSAYCEYPSGGANASCDCSSLNYNPHGRGQVLSSIWKRIRDGVGLEPARQLHVNWCLITLGASADDPCNGTDAGTGCEVLAAIPQDSASIPYSDIVCESFSEHGIDLEQCQ